LFSHHLTLSREVKEYSGLLEGVVDLHVHTAPDVLQRAVDDIEYLEDLNSIGYIAYLSKNHFVETASRAYLLNRIGKGTKVLGGIVLNWPVGGLNPSAVDKALALGAAEVWMPTLDAENHIKTFGSAALPTTNRVRSFRSYRTQGGMIRILDGNGELKPEVMEILELVAESNAILGTGHLSFEEVCKLVGVAKKVGVKKILVTHPHFKATRFKTEDQLRLVSMGAIIEHCAVAGYNPSELAEDIRRVGPNNCIISSDAGQPHKGHPVDVLLKMILDLKEHGVSDHDIELMIKRNPVRLVEHLI